MIQDSEAPVKPGQAYVIKTVRRPLEIVLFSCFLTVIANRLEQRGITETG